MTIQYQSGLFITGTNTDRTGGTWTNLAAGWKFLETDTGSMFYWNGTAWVSIGGGAGGPPSGSAGGDLTGSYPNPTINVNKIDNTKTADMAANTVKGNATASTTDPSDIAISTNSVLGRLAANVAALTGTQLTTILDAFTSTLKGLVPASGGGTTTWLRADGTWQSIPPAEITGTATGAANGSATVFTIAHGLGAVPYSAFVIPSSVLGSTINYSYTYDATNITVTFASAPSTGTITFQWRVVA